MQEPTKGAPVTALTEHARVQTEVSLFVLLWSLLATAAAVFAMLWIGGGDGMVRDAVRQAAFAILLVGLVMAVIGTLLSWAMGRRWSNNVLIAARALDQVQSVSAGRKESPAPTALAPSWRAFVKDPLTGLFNQGALLAFADDAIPYYRRYKRGVSILMVEIDRFQAVFDEFGADGTNQALRHVADVLDLSVRKTDKVACFGSNKFVVLLREISETDTLALANRIRDAVSDLGVRHLGRVVAITVSIGSAIVAEGDMRSETLIDRAEIALGIAKRDGGNRVAFQAAADYAPIENVA